MNDATMGVLAGVVLMAWVLMGWQAAKALWAGEYLQGAGVLTLMGLLVLGTVSPVVLGLLVLLALAVGGFLFFADRAWRETSFWGTWTCYDLAGDCLKLAGWVLVALVQVLSESTKS